VRPYGLELYTHGSHDGMREVARYALALEDEIVTLDSKETEQAVVIEILEQRISRLEADARTCAEAWLYGEYGRHSKAPELCQANVCAAARRILNQESPPCPKK
jgi:hypothetical protein